MILSGADIRQYLKFGGLKFNPPLEEDQFQQNGVDLYLERAEPRGRKLFTLGCTREWVTMPNDLMAFVELRSTWARRGIMIPPTIIDAGFSGVITLELAILGDTEAPVGERFAHLIFGKLGSPSEPYNGKYQHQTGITGAK